MIWRRTNPFPQSNVGDETKVSVRLPQLSPLALKEYLLQSDHVVGHFPAVIPSLLPRSVHLATSRIGRFRHSNNTSPYSAIRTIDKKVWFDRYLDAFDAQRRELRAFTQRHWSHAEGVFSVQK